ncbi:MAG: DUF4199 domain-containing protein [Muribaculaceae bacterium]|nr:DUF4199 domain-containing protein [Muribaculaceae bacterium]
MINQSSNNPRTVFRRGADDGFLMGIFLSVLFIALVNSIYSAIATVATVAMALAVPFLTFFFLRRSYRSDNCRSTFSALWLHGICIFFFGSLLMALTSYVYLRFINPSYITDVLRMAKEVYSAVGTDDAMEMVALMQKIEDSHMLPTGGQVAVEIIWTGVFTGSLLSMVVSAIVRAVTRPTPPPPPSNLQQF